MVSKLAAQYKIPPAAIWTGLVLFCVIALSFILYLFGGRDMQRTVFFFPDYQSRTISGESRMLPRRGDSERDIELYVREALLGPIDIRHDRLFPESSDLHTIMLREGKLYIDLSVDAVLGSRSSELSFAESVFALKKGIRFNYPEANDIIISIDGVQPNLEVGEKVKNQKNR